MNNQDSSIRSGCFIALTGVMGVGKSSIARVLARKMQGELFIEPEADAWPVPPNERWEDHIFALEQWVRNTNLDLFAQAKSSSERNIVAIADGGLFLLAKEYMHDPACGFYYDLFTTEEKLILRADAESDWLSAPRPDILIVVEADIDLWKSFLVRRARSMDENKEFIAHYHGQQRAIRAAAEKYASEKGVRLVIFEIQSSDLEVNASDLLVDLGVIRPRA